MSPVRKGYVTFLSVAIVSSVLCASLSACASRCFQFEATKELGTALFWAKSTLSSKENECKPSAVIGHHRMMLLVAR